MMDREDICDKLSVEMNAGVIKSRWYIVEISAEKYTKL